MYLMYILCVFMMSNDNQKPDIRQLLPESEQSGEDMPTKAAITLKLSQREMRVLDELAEKKELTKVAVIRQALRLYQLLDARLALGEKVLVEDAAGVKTTELILL